jgi:predicted PurR-regulated permease PerM
METPHVGDRAGAGDPAWLIGLRRYGIASWSALGIIGLVVVVCLAFGAVSGVMVPLVIAVMLGTVLSPIAASLERRGARPVLAALAALLVFALVAAGIIVLVTRGFIQQVPEISSQLNAGWSSFLVWGNSLDLDTIWLERARAAVQDYAPRLGEGVLGLVTDTFFGLISLAFGVFFAVFFLFFVIRDRSKFPDWVARLTGTDPALADKVISLVQGALSGYFRGVAVTAIITAPVFMVPLLLLRVPLAIPIFIMYFVLSFVPFVGAWITGIFAVLIAFGSGGSTAALIVLVSLLVSNGTVQTAVSSWALGSSLKMHPVAVLVATMVGGVIAGILGMVLAPPLLSATTKAAAAIRAQRDADSATDEADAGLVPPEQG